MPQNVQRHNCLRWKTQVIRNRSHDLADARRACSSRRKLLGRHFRACSVHCELGGLLMQGFQTYLGLTPIKVRITLPYLIFFIFRCLYILFKGLLLVKAEVQHCATDLLPQCLRNLLKIPCPNCWFIFRSSGTLLASCTCFRVQNAPFLSRNAHKAQASHINLLFTATRFPVIRAHLSNCIISTKSLWACFSSAPAANSELTTQMSTPIARRR